MEQITTYAYDSLGHRTLVLDAAGHLTSTLYDALGRPYRQIDAEGRITTSVYDAASRLLAVVNPSGNATSFSYDAAGRKLTETDPLGRVTSFSYDVVGNLTRRENARGQVVSYSYSANRELIGEHYPDDRRHTYTYDDAGNRTQIADATGVTTLVYDTRNLLESMTNPDGQSVTYSYNALRQRTSMIDPEGGRTTYSYDSADRLVGIVNPQGKRTTLSYDAKGRKERIEHGNGALTTHTYDCADRVTQIEHRQSGSALVNLTTYTYDDVGNRIRAIESSGDVTTWTYDATYQLTHEVRSGSHSFDVTYTYYAAGNRLTEIDSGAVTTSTYDAANQLLAQEDASGLTSYSYDADGNRTCRDTSSETIYYEWDENDRLTVAEPPSGKTTLTYRGDGRRVQKETPTATTKFIYDLNRLLEETDGDDDMQRQYTSTLAEWGELLSEYDRSETHDHLSDVLGSTDALLDESQTATDRYQYRAFGVQTQQGSHASPFTFVGSQNYYRDSELELYYAAARYYDPEAGRWLSEDPLGLAAGDTNPYRYVKNNSVNHTDPSGLLSPGWHLRITADALDDSGFAPETNPKFRTAILVGCVYPDVPLPEVESLVGREMTPEQILRAVDAFNNNWFIRAYRNVTSTVKDLSVPDFITDNAVVNDVRDWWKSSSFIDLAIQAAVWAKPEIKKTLMYRSQKGDLSYWHGMADGSGTAIIRRIADRLTDQTVLDAYRSTPNDPYVGFLIGQRLHTIEDLFTRSHVARNEEGLITRFQDYAKQSPTHHGTEDVLDVLTPKSKSTHETLLKQTTAYLNWLEEYRMGKITKGEFRKRVIRQFLTTVPGGAWIGGTQREYAPRKSVTGSVVAGISGAATTAGQWAYDTGASIWKWFTK